MTPVTYIRPAVALCAWVAMAAPSHAQLSVAADWAERPEAASISAFYPKIALALEIEGEVSLSCRVTVTGVLEACSVLREQPAGVGFAGAALSMSKTFQMRPPISLGSTKVDDAVRIPVRFKLPEAKPVGVVPTGTPEIAALVRRLNSAVDPLSGVAASYETQARELDFLVFAGVAEDAGPAAGSALRRAARDGLPEAREQLGLLLASRLTALQLRQLVTFAETPEGKRYLDGDPKVQATRASISREAARRRLVAVREAFCAIRSCTVAPHARQPDSQNPEQADIETGWAQEPTQREIVRAWPVSWMVGLSGFAKMDCLVGVQGALEECRILAESPSGVGVGDAALSLSSRYRLTATRLNAGMLGRHVNILRYFTAPNPPAPLMQSLASPNQMTLAAQLLEIQMVSEPEVDLAIDLEKIFETFPVADPKLREDLRSARVAAFPVWTAAMKEGRTRALATNYDQPTLEAAIGFEKEAGAAVRRAWLAAREETDALGYRTNSRIAAKARATFCVGRPCLTVLPEPASTSPATSPRKP